MPPAPRTRRRLTQTAIAAVSLALVGGGWAAADRAHAFQHHGEATTTKSVEIRIDETLAHALQRAGASDEDAREALAALAPALDAQNVHAGVTLDVIYGRAQDPFAHGPLLSLSLVRGGDAAVTLERAFDGALRLRGSDAVKDVTTVADGVLQGSLYESAERAGADPALVAQAVTLFARRLDFARDLQTGDRFRLIYDRRITAAGRTVETGDLLYAEIGDGARIARFYAFDRGGRTEFFDETGRDVRGLLLATPVDGARITSAFGLREHPILGYTRMHQGIDFGAPVGTPVFAAGDGVVVEAGPWGGYGNWLRIRHADGWETGYAHLSTYAAGLRPGMPVRQGQLVAFVGATGLATGPHLHYEVWRGGERVNPITAGAPRGVELAGDDLADFYRQKARIDRMRIASGRAPAPGSASAAAGLRPTV